MPPSSRLRPPVYCRDQIEDSNQDLPAATVEPLVKDCHDESDAHHTMRGTDTTQRRMSIPPRRWHGGLPYVSTVERTVEHASTSASTPVLPQRAPRTTHSAGRRERPVLWRIFFIRSGPQEVWGDLAGYGGVQIQIQRDIAGYT